jgi:hypothetical protein
MRGDRLGLSLIATITILSGEAFGKAGVERSTAGAIHDGRMIVAGNRYGVWAPPGTGKPLPKPVHGPPTLNKAPAGPSDQVLPRAVREQLARERARKYWEPYARSVREYCKKNPHRPNCRS